LRIIQTKTIIMNNDKDSAEKAMDAIANAAPLVTFILACLAFLCVLLFKTDYYTEIFSQRWNWWASLGVGFGAGVAAEGSRAILLVLTFRDFRKGNTWGAGLGLLLSFALVGYEIFSAGPISSLWTGGSSAAIGPIIRDVIVFLVSLSAGLELRLALSSRGEAKQNKQRNETETATTAATLRRINETETQSQNETQHNTSNVATATATQAQHNTTETQAQRNAIGFQVDSSEKWGSEKLINELSRAKNNMRAYKSKVAKAKEDSSMNLSTQKKGYEKWKSKVEALERQIEAVKQSA